jgi:hypothetical protein
MRRRSEGGTCLQFVDMYKPVSRDIARWQWRDECRNGGQPARGLALRWQRRSSTDDA